MQTLWGALVASHFLLGLALWFVRFGPSARPLKHAPPELFAPMFAGVAGVQAILSFVMPRYTMGIAVKNLKLTGRPTDEQLVKLLPAAQTGMILGLALCESITLLGFVLGFLGVQLEHFAPFFVVGLLLALTKFPGPDALRAQVPGAR